MRREKNILLNFHCISFYVLIKYFIYFLTFKIFILTLHNDYVILRILYFNF